MTVNEILARLESLGDDAGRAHNTKAGAPDNQFGVKLGDIRVMAKKIGEKIGLYRDWPVSKGCTPPYVPIWLEAMVKRQG